MDKKTRAPRSAQPGAAKKAIVACGHLCLDLIPAFPAAASSARTSPAAGVHDYFRPGRLSVVGAPVVATGGAVSNVGLSLHRLGLPSRLVAKVGSDPLGRIVLERVASLGTGLTRGITAVEGETTSYSVVLSPPGVDRIFLHCPGANDTFVDADVADSSLREAAIFHFGYPPLMEKIWSDGGRRLARLLRRARQQGAITSLDMSLPDPASPSAGWTGTGFSPGCCRPLTSSFRASRNCSSWSIVGPSTGSLPAGAGRQSSATWVSRTSPTWHRRR